MNNYYFTYGTEGHPFRGGWTLIQAEDEMQARAVFQAVHPNKIPGLLNCSSVYTEEHFQRTAMAKAGNFGQGCHELISIQRRATE